MESVEQPDSHAAQEWPYIPQRPPVGHGTIALNPSDCTACNLCVTECPTWCISLSSQSVAQPGPGRTRVTKVLTEFSIDFGLCMYCGICVDVCPFDALAWVPQPVDVAIEREDLVEQIPDLARRWPRQPED